MGSFSVSCAMTGVTLSNRPAVLIPLAPAQYCSPSRRAPSVIGGSLIVSNEGAGALYGPLALPIVGRVGDYGDLEDIVEDENTRFLRFRIKDFDGFIEAVSRGGNVPEIDKVARRVYRNHDQSSPYTKQLRWGGNLSGCWVSREAWDLFSTHSWDDGGKEDHKVIGTEGWINPRVLVGLGFVRGTKDQATAESIFGKGPHEGDRYHTLYTHPDMPDLVLWCDEYMSSKASYKGVKLEDFCTFPRFLAALKKVGLKLPAVSLKWATETSVYRGVLLNARKARRSWRDMERRHQERLKEVPQLHWHQVSSETLPIFGGIKQVWCDSDLFSSGPAGHTHVVIYGQTAIGDVTDWKLEPCDIKEGRHECGVYGTGMKFPEAVWQTLQVRGWKPPVRRRLDLSSSDPYMRLFPEETMVLYGKRFLSDPFLPMVEATLTFMQNMYAANRYLAPTVTGYQCGHFPIQERVAKLALKMARDELKRRRRD